MNQKRVLLFAATSGLLAVALGAFGSHGLNSAVESGLISEDLHHAFETGVKYQFYHTIILLVMPALSLSLHSRSAKLSAMFFILGIGLFCGSLYLMATAPVLFGSEFRWLGPVTPAGGLLLMLGWLFLLLAVIRRK